jgi:hypothetical protein
MEAALVCRVFLADFLRVDTPDACNMALPAFLVLNESFLACLRKAVLDVAVRFCTPCTLDAIVPSVEPMDSAILTSVDLCSSVFTVRTLIDGSFSFLKQHGNYRNNSRWPFTASFQSFPFPAHDLYGILASA